MKLERYPGSQPRTHSQKYNIDVFTLFTEVKRSVKTFQTFPADIVRLYIIRTPISLDTSLHKGCQWKKNCTLTLSMDFPTKWSINDGKMCQNFCEWDLFLIIQILGMHYGTLKMRKALPFCVSSFHPIFWLKSLPLCIYRWEKVKKVNPILALCIYGPLGKLLILAQFVTILEPVSPFFFGP